MSREELQTRSINTIRFLSADAVQQAKSGHPGLPMGTAAMAYTIWTRHLRHNPKNPHWANRDRFILSGGHGSSISPRHKPSIKGECFFEYPTGTFLRYQMAMMIFTDSMDRL